MSGVRLLVVLLASVLMGACALPLMPERQESHALDVEDAARTTLGRALAPQLRQHPGLSGTYMLDEPLAAFAARMLLAQAAERSLDVQYYIWHGDRTGTLLLQALVDAAERGVRVRLLLDDGGTSGLDDELAMLAEHPHIEVRLFNPLLPRWPKRLGYVSDFSRTNRRMHNKSFTADNQATIVGGRNVGDEYFGATDGILFADLDVLAVGPIAQAASADFDRYWASASAWPVQAIVPAADAITRAELAARVAGLVQSGVMHAYARTVQETDFVSELLARRLPLEWNRVDMVSDDPAKGLAQTSRAGLLLDQLHRVTGVPQRLMDLVSPYFVPTEHGTRALVQLSQSGVAVRVLTNAYEATDVPLVHAGYARHRKALLEGGVALYEMRRRMPATRGGGGGRNRLGSSGSSLHAKTFVVDSERVFVGSFNFDPRSALLNTESGFVIHSADLARRMHRAFDVDIPAYSYTLRLSEEGGRVEWLDSARTPPVVYRTEPGSTWWSRSMLRVLSWLPIDGLL